MALAIFDLDNTLIADDSDYLWGQFIVNRGIVDKDSYEQANAHFYEQYQQGRLDIREFLAFSLKPLADHDPAQLHAWRQQFVDEVIRPIQLHAAQQLVDMHRARGDTLLVITATNRFVTEPIVRLYGIEHLLATTPEFVDGRYTGRFLGEPCYREGKVAYLRTWAAEQRQSLQGSWFYSDSHNDLALLQQVDHPVAVNPDATLLQHATAAGWPVLDLRNGHCSGHHLK